MELPPSHDTAICLLPPRHLWPSIDRLRSLHDKAYGTWPPHIKLVYPFVHPGAVSEAVHRFCELDLDLGQLCPHQVTLHQADAFTHNRHNTIHLGPAPESDSLSQFIRALHLALGRDDGSDFRPHLSIAQSQDAHSDLHKFLLDKARLLAPLAWQVGQLAVLVREEARHSSHPQRRMMLWGCIDIETRRLTRPSIPTSFYDTLTLLDTVSGNKPSVTTSINSKSLTQTTFQFNSNGAWHPLSISSPLLAAGEMPDRLTVASYNVLAETEWPPSSVRYPGLIANILSSRAAADILVLLEVTDHFLRFLLSDEAIWSRYPFSTHGSPDQQAVAPLSSHINIVILSRYPFTWETLSSQRKHKDIAVLEFPALGIPASSEPDCLPLILAACHLSPGLFDDAIVAKKNELQRLVGHLTITYPQHPWVVAGDFNLATSSHTIEQAQRMQAVSSQSHQYLRDIDTMLLEAGLQDTWLATRIESGESSGGIDRHQDLAHLYEGEQGATFNPLTNSLAAKVGGTSSNSRPQRYDRILINRNLPLRSRGFNVFGHAATEQAQLEEFQFSSDHWGIRCLLVRPPTSDVPSKSPPRLIDLPEAPATLGTLYELREYMATCGYIPNGVDEIGRKEAIELLERVLTGPDEDTSSSRSKGKLNLIVVPVGSYGLGVWTTSSDVDCLCVGDISSRTFFALGLQRLRRASSTGITVLRRVKANSGIMLELDIRGIKFDLQYCAATCIVENWPEVMLRPSSDPAFALPVQALGKLKPARDLYYLRRSIPDMAQYRLAHIAIKAWAESRGLYAPKFGLLGGIHISVMLVPVCKMLAHEGVTPSTAEIVTSFFHHYARFDWKQDMVFDPFFHKSIKYHRTFREPLCLLGWHSPSLNTAMNASLPTVKTLMAEFARASAMLSVGGLKWDEFLDSRQSNQSGATADAEFLQAFNSYVKIDAHYWGPSPSKGHRFLGWLESRCVRVLDDIDRKIPDLMARIWPARFAESPLADDAEYHVCYLIGLEWQSDSAMSASKEERKVAGGALEATLRAFEAQIRSNERYYDANSSYMSATMARGSSVSKLRPDESRWGYADVGDSDSEADDDDWSPYGEEEEEEEEEEAESTPGPGLGREASVQSRPGDSPPKTGRFRTAIDVMNRLRWDGSMDPSDYIVGYLDRFVGASERPLEQWKSEQTDEEFIPQHRILYFKRRSDGAIVWERRTRIDEIFGSGARGQRLGYGVPT